MSASPILHTDTDEVSVKDLFLKFKDSIKYIKTKWKLILAFAIIGSVLGIAYSSWKKPVYTATCTFVLEESGKGSMLNQYAGLASLAGIDLGGGGGIFQGDNIIELYKSRMMIEKTLLCKGNFNGKKQLLIERYADFNNLWERWNTGYLSKISFDNNPQSFNRRQDSIITDITNLFNKKVLTVLKPDKKLSIINVSLSNADELFAKVFTDSLVQNVNNFYVQTKTKKTLHNINVLQLQRDSVRRVLDYSLSGVASSIDATPNANPAFLTLRVPSQKKQVDVQSSSTIYVELVKNLELSRMSLRQETPLIQVIDRPVLPLPVEKLTKLKSVIIGFFLMGFLTIIALLIGKFFKTIIA